MRTKVSLLTLAILILFAGQQQAGAQVAGGPSLAPARAGLASTVARLSTPRDAAATADRRADSTGEAPPAAARPGDAADAPHSADANAPAFGVIPAASGTSTPAFSASAPADAGSAAVFSHAARAASPLAAALFGGTPGAGATPDDACREENDWQRLLKPADANASALGAAAVPAAATAAAIQGPLTPVIINEFRFRGSMGELDEFVELYNNSDSPITVSTSDGSSGWAVAAFNPGGTSPQIVAVVPNNTILPPRSYYLITNSNRYSLTAHAARDISYSDDIKDGAGIALFRTAFVSQFTTSNRLDAVGFSTAPADYREGSGLAPVCPNGPDGYPRCTGNTPELTFTRRQPLSLSGLPQDTANNAADFLFLTVTGAVMNGVQSYLGAPGPQNSVSPINRNNTIPAVLLDPAVPSSSPPNRVRRQCSDPLVEECRPDRSALGTMSIRRTFTNNTGGPVTRMRFRVIDITSYPPPNATTADIRFINSGNITVQLSNGTTVPVSGTVIDAPPPQDLGGAFNTSFSTTTVTLATPLPPGGTVSVQYLYGVQQSGNFRVWLNIEAIGDPPQTGNAPTVYLTSPANGQIYNAPATIDIAANAADTDGFVRRVDFYVLSPSNSTAAPTLINSDDTPPYEARLTNVQAGTYTFTAKAVDDNNNTTTSAPVSVTVQSGPPPPGPVPELGACKVANVVALDQVFFYNRLGAFNPAGMIYALRRDVVAVDPSKGLAPGNVQLRPGKRARPIVLRMNVKECITINFQNLLAPAPKDDNQPHTRSASVHVQGLQLVRSILDDGSNVGQNPSSLVPPGGTATYTYYAEKEGGNLLYSTAATTGGEGDGGTLAMGLFGSVNVEPENAEYYRSQVTEEDLRLATVGRFPSGHPNINYDATYPSTHPRAGLPILRMTLGQEIVHSDLNAIITGFQRFFFPLNAFPPVTVAPQRNQSFREFTTIYHDEIKAVQAFDLFEDPVMEHTLHSVRDAFAINYGTGGIGSEILANRFGVGPMHACDECLYEEFFLSSWAVADPAMIVDVPANTRNEKGELITGPKATRVFFPDDPSNVHHSYLNDHVKFRVLHAGPKEHHIHHLHAHQWLHTPNLDASVMLDSQAIGPGSSFTTEIAHGGSGNRGKTIGDAIFHCHFYPHFAMGMWELWRVHDTLEEGTVLDGAGRPAFGARALPDGEIQAGTPIPALVPIPRLAMAPLPSPVYIQNGQICFGNPGLSTSTQCNRTGTNVTVNPGYPFFVPGIGGRRPPAPPLDLAIINGQAQDGGLPRHIILDATVAAEFHDRLNFDKLLGTIDAIQLPDDGTPIEKVAMNFHEVRNHPTVTTDGTTASFIANGRPRKPGAPYADPCVDDSGNPKGVELLYKSAVFQWDIKFNKAGWHFPQQRMSAFWSDVQPTRDGTRPPQPFFFRANTNHCLVFWHTNLVPRVYVQDDFQVRTPTDIMGQHIHLVKFDVTSSDGAANGFNYEDGTMSPEEVQERIAHINENGGLRTWENPSARITLTARPHPFFGVGPDDNRDGKPDWLGAQTTIQRWFADDVRDAAGDDRTHRTAFTHDHFGPSTHQQVGQYAGLIIEPEGSRWRDPEVYPEFIFGPRELAPPGNVRDDGGPTKWFADILTPDPNESFREFLIEFADFQHAYRAGGGIDQFGRPVPDPINVINPPAKQQAPFQPPFVLLEKMQVCPGTNIPPPCPEAISAADVGTMVVNYRNEPIPHRIVVDPNASVPQQAGGLAGDLAHVYRSDITRAYGPMNSQPGFYPPLSADVQPGDPFTPLMRAYEDDKVMIKILVGAHEEGHNFTVNGIKWLFEPPVTVNRLNNTGWRNSQMMGISEHFEFVVPVLPLSQESPGPFTRSFYDFRYAPGMAVDDQWNGMWGILRAYRGAEPTSGDVIVTQPEMSATQAAALSNVSEADGTVVTTPATLLALPSNPDGRAGTASTSDPSALASDSVFPGTSTVPVCPADAGTPPPFDVTAMLARDLLPQQTLVYNPRTNVGGRLEDPTAIIYVRTSDIDPATGRLFANRNVEPLILRARAGDCITLTLRNQIPAAIDQPGFNTMPMIIDNFNANQVMPSSHVGLHPQLLYYDVSRSDGMNVGFNFVQTAAPGASVTYKWYAGDVRRSPLNPSQFFHVPVEFGATNLMPADPIKHSNKGAVGALIIEPQGATINENLTNSEGKITRAVALITPSGGPAFREFVMLFQDDINMRFGSRVSPYGWLQPVPNLAGEDDPEDTAQKAINYRTEPLWKRMGFEPDTDFEITRTFDFTNSLSNIQVGGDPVTPVFTASRGEYVRFRVVQGGGHARNHVFQINGHNWQEEPYVNDSNNIGDNPLSEVRGTQHGVGPSSHFDIDLRIGAGGRFLIRGDFLYRDRASFTFDGGMWGIFRVQ